MSTLFTCSLITKWFLYCIFSIKGYIAMARKSRRRVVVLFKRGLKLKKIKARLEEDGILVSSLKTLKKFVYL